MMSQILILCAGLAALSWAVTVVRKLCDFIYQHLEDPAAARAHGDNYIAPLCCSEETDLNGGEWISERF